MVKAFTQTELDKEIYVQIPPQFNMPGKCFKAVMSLEGLKQSGYLFQVEAFNQVRKLGGIQSTVEPNIWYIGKGSERITIGFWVAGYGVPALGAPLKALPAIVLAFLRGVSG